MSLLGPKVFPGFAKVNLYFRILGSEIDYSGDKPDSKHLVETLLYSLSLHDDVEINLDLGVSNEKEIVCEMNGVAGSKDIDNSHNLAVLAAELVLKCAKVKNYHLNININKNIPLGAGLAGGSSNAAAVIYGLHSLLPKNLQIAEDVLLEITRKLGTDIAFAYLTTKNYFEKNQERTVAIGSHFGEIVQEVEGCVDLRLKTKTFSKGISTPLSYSTFDMDFPNKISNLNTEKNIQNLIKGLQCGDFKKVKSNLFN
ncbi:MAG: hypothetical protein LBM13_06135, partial [Candidatus Ancillula sp.]|nr:hypothetical protein [Candidatus Ancillula sp.]